MWPFALPVAARRCVPPRSAANTQPACARSFVALLPESVIFSKKLARRDFSFQCPPKNSISPRVKRDRRQACCSFRSDVRGCRSIGRLRRTNVGRDFAVSIATANLHAAEEWPVRKIQSDQHLFVAAPSKIGYYAGLIRIPEPDDRAAPQRAARSSQRHHLFVEPRKLGPPFGNRPKDWHLFKQRRRAGFGRIAHFHAVVNQRHSIEREHESRGGECSRLAKARDRPPLVVVVREAQMKRAARPFPGFFFP